MAAFFCLTLSISSFNRDRASGSNAQRKQDCITRDEMKAPCTSFTNAARELLLISLEPYILASFISSLSYVPRPSLASPSSTHAFPLSPSSGLLQCAHPQLPANTPRLISSSSQGLICFRPSAFPSTNVQEYRRATKDERQGGKPRFRGPRFSGYVIRVNQNASWDKLAGLTERFRATA